MNAVDLTDDQIREARREYMRRYRARKGGTTDSDRAVHRAQTAAAKWVRHNHPAIWRHLLDEAWKQIRP